MNAYDAYKQTQNLPRTRIDVILTLYRKSLANLEKARQALSEQKAGAALSFLVNTQTIVMALAAELPAYKDELARNFLRLYEFVSHQMTQGKIENVDAAAKVLRILLTGFEAVREEAANLELQGKIPPLENHGLLSLTA
jgi:flagellar biosynthetic protein FliS